MIQRGSDTKFTNLWSLLLYILLLLHYLRMQKKTRNIQNETKLSYSRAENNQRIKGNEEKVCRFVCWKMFIVN
jgi:hypothetical protein